LSHGRLLNQTDTGTMAMNSCFGTLISGENTRGPYPPQCARNATRQRMYFARSWSARIGSSVVFT
jgi:hypothetical protein